jgi:hypothetical protein
VGSLSADPRNRGRLVLRSPWYTDVGFRPVQPVPYSHELHVGEPGLDCRETRGDGKGILFQRGNVPTASFHQERILKYPDGQIFDVIPNGQGLMAGYRWPIPPADRWAIVAHAQEFERKRLASARRARGQRLREAP